MWRRAEQTGQRYVGVLTDGREWHAYHEQDGTLVDDTQHVLNPTKPDGTALLYWLEGVLKTRQGVPPTPDEIRAQLGATLKVLYESVIGSETRKQLGEYYTPD